jgi:hypothetical protein
MKGERGSSQITPVEILLRVLFCWKNEVKMRLSWWLRCDRPAVIFTMTDILEKKP